MMSSFIDKYRDESLKLIKSIPKEEILEAVNVLKELKTGNKKLFIFGNGASSSISSHFSLDFTKQAKIRSMTFSDSSTLTAFSNDYGYENSFMEYLKAHHDNGDVVIFISCSGNSPNLVNCAEYAAKKQIKIISLTGFNGKNKLSEISDISLSVDSKAYNLIESIHTLYMSILCDSIIGKMEYSVS